MKYFYTVAFAVFVSLCTAHDHYNKHEDCRNNIFQISGKFFSKRIIASYQNSFPKIVTYADLNSGYNKYRKGGSYLHSRDEIEDADGNRFYTTKNTRTVYGYLQCLKRRYLTSPCLNDATYAMTVDKRIVFIAVKNSGPLYVFETDKPEVKGNKIVLKTIKEVGEHVTSISVNPENGDIAIGRRQGNGGNVLLIRQIAKDPCESSDAQSSNARVVQIKNELKQNYKELMANMGCENAHLRKFDLGVINACQKMKKYETIMHDGINMLSKFYEDEMENQPKEQAVSTTLKYPENSHTECEVENNKIDTLVEAFSSQENKTKNAQDMLDALIEGSDRILGLGDELETDLSVKGNTIDEFSLRNYKCLLEKEWKETEKNILAVREQAKYLMLGLEIVKNSFELEELEVPPE